MNDIAYGPDQQDALREIVNIAMGQAADSLARLFDVFVKLPVPRIRWVEAPRMLDSMREMLDKQDKVTAVRQAFSGPMHGEALAVFDANGCGDLAELMGYEGESHSEDELLLDVSNVLIGACLLGIATQLAYDMSFSAPSIMLRSSSLDGLIDPARPLPWSTALLVEVNFKIEDRAFLCHVFVFWPETSMARLREAIDAFLETLG